MSAKAPLQLIDTNVRGAIGLQQQYQLAFWDAMIIHSAAETGCTLIWSEDFSPGRFIRV